MAFKFVVVCAFAFIVQSISGQAIGCGCSSGSSGYSGSSAISSGYSGSSVISSGYSGSSAISSSSSGISSGGSFPVTSLGPISPSGIAVDSQCDLAGTLDVQGALPFLSCVQFQENLPTSGSGCVDYSCGCGSNVGITSVTGGSSNLGGCGCNL